MANLRPQKVVLDYNRLGLMILISVIVYNEFLVYFKTYYYWPNVDRHFYEDRISDDLLKILFVADPQIQGSHDSNFPLVGMIKRWDSDRYLAKTFAWAFWAYRPHLIIYLGDLMDEGSECPDEEFKTYVSRFKSIYSNKANNIYVPGDNDIGGEGSDPVTDDKVQRFDKYFPSKDIYSFTWAKNKLVEKLQPISNNKIKHPTIEIIPTNLLTFMSPEHDWYPHIQTPKPDHVKYRIAVSHMPVLPVPGMKFSRNVMKQIQPSVIFSAHDHRGLDYTTFRNSTKEKRPIGNITLFTQYAESDDEVNKFLNIPNDHRNKENIHEVIVPTCSYRMGVKEMAFGLATIDLSSDVEDSWSHIIYVNLWLPSRFSLLYAYILAVTISLSLMLVGKFKRRPGSGRRTSLGTPKHRSRRSSASNSTLAHSYSKLV